MIKTISVKGDKYSLHFKDATPVGGKHMVRWSRNEIDDTMDIGVLMPQELTIDQLVELIQDKFGVK